MTWKEKNVKLLAAAAIIHHIQSETHVLEDTNLFMALSVAFDQAQYAARLCERKIEKPPSPVQDGKTAASGERMWWMDKED